MTSPRPHLVVGAEQVDVIVVLLLGSGGGAGGGVGHTRGAVLTQGLLHTWKTDNRRRRGLLHWHPTPAHPYTLMTSASSPVLLVLVRLDVVEPAEGVAQVSRGGRRDRLEDRHVGLRGDVPEDADTSLAYVQHACESEERAR